MVIDTVARLADSVGNGTPPPLIPPPWDSSPAMLALRDAHGRAAARALAPEWAAAAGRRDRLRDRIPDRHAVGRERAGGCTGWRTGWSTSSAAGRLAGSSRSG